MTVKQLIAALESLPADKQEQEVHILYDTACGSCGISEVSVLQTNQALLEFGDVAIWTDQ